MITISDDYSDGVAVSVTDANGPSAPAPVIEETEAEEPVSGEPTVEEPIIDVPAGEEPAI